MNRLTRQVVAKGYAEEGAAGGGVAGAGEEGMEGELAGATAGGGLGLGSDETVHLPGPGSYEKTLDAARNMISEDPKRVAQVVRKWIGEDAG